jgi:hypothetical protein
MSHRLDPPVGLDLVQLAELHDIALVVFVFVLMPLIAAISGATS